MLFVLFPRFLISSHSLPGENGMETGKIEWTAVEEASDNYSSTLTEICIVSCSLVFKVKLG